MSHKTQVYLSPSQGLHQYGTLNFFKNLFFDDFVHECSVFGSYLTPEPPGLPFLNIQHTEGQGS